MSSRHRARQTALPCPSRRLLWTLWSPRPPGCPALPPSGPSGPPSRREPRPRPLTKRLACVTLAKRLAGAVARHGASPPLPPPAPPIIATMTPRGSARRQGVKPTEWPWKIREGPQPSSEGRPDPAQRLTPRRARPAEVPGGGAGARPPPLPPLMVCPCNALGPWRAAMSLHGRWKGEERRHWWPSSSASHAPQALRDRSAAGGRCHHDGQTTAFGRRSLYSAGAHPARGGRLRLRQGEAPPPTRPNRPSPPAAARSQKRAQPGGRREQTCNHRVRHRQPKRKKKGESGRCGWQTKRASRLWAGAVQKRRPVLRRG